MGFMKKGKQEGISPDMAGDRPQREWWPDLTAYRKAILLHNITFDEIHTLLKEYAEISTDRKQAVCDFFYTALPDDTAWVYVEVPNLENAPHYVTFWNYQNLLIWFSQKADREFCLAIPENQQHPLFLSAMDKKNPYGDSCVGVYADRDFHFEVPGDVFEWGPVPTSAFPIAGFLYETFQFDTRWIPKVAQCQWKKSQVTLTFS